MSRNVMGGGCQLSWKNALRRFNVIIVKRESVGVKLETFSSRDVYVNVNVNVNVTICELRHNFVRRLLHVYSGCVRQIRRIQERYVCGVRIRL